jgi:hypothetical protein
VLCCRERRGTDLPACFQVMPCTVDRFFRHTQCRPAVDAAHRPLCHHAQDLHLQLAVRKLEPNGRYQLSEHVTVHNDVHIVRI